MLSRIYGDNGVEGVHLVKRMGEADEQRYDLAIDGFFQRKYNLFSHR